MDHHGFIRDMMDVKVLILYVMARVSTPVDVEKIYELCFQDDCLTYFDVREAVPQLVQTGHLAGDADGLFQITEKGRDQGGATEDSIAFTVKQKALAAVEAYNRAARRRNLIHAEIVLRPDGDYSVVMGLDDEKSSLMKLELMAPNESQAKALSRAFSRCAERIFQMVMTELLREAESKNHVGI